MFDNKPVIIREWTPTAELVKQELKSLPIWVKLYDLDLKFWGTECLKKIGGLTRKVLKTDEATEKRNFLGCKGIVHRATDCRNKAKSAPKVCRKKVVPVVLSTPVTGGQRVVPIPPSPAKVVSRINRQETHGEPVETAKSQGVSTEAERQPVEQGDKGKEKVVVLNVSPAEMTNISLSQPVQNDGQNELMQVVELVLNVIIDSIGYWNVRAERRTLWRDLRTYSSLVDDAWIIGGDFNNVLYSNERLGSEITLAEVKPFLDCTHDCKITDLKAVGSFFTWNNKQKVATRVYIRIDRALINDEWLEAFPDAYAHFMTEGTFDHCPCMIHLDGPPRRKNVAFKYYNMWALAPAFQEIVEKS
ncbi:uncharacterized protein LOC141649737 [Silene latifolia]|uniref:uncharacterized protein LOC141649737 n=1 Tax=Silene latifolia TaxID=37657 RepID=UPI003D76F2A2